MMMVRALAMYLYMYKIFLMDKASLCVFLKYGIWQLIRMYHEL